MLANSCAVTQVAKNCAILSQIDMAMINSSLDAALYRARQWLTNAEDRRARFVPTAHMRADQVAIVQEKLDTDVEEARARVSGLEQEVWKLEANFGGIDALSFGQRRP